MNEYLPKIDSPLDNHATLKKLNKKELKFLSKFCQKEKKRSQNWLSVNIKSRKNFITIITKTIEIFYLHSSKGLKKSTSKTSSNQRYKEDLERYKNFSFNESKKKKKK